MRQQNQPPTRFRDLATESMSKETKQLADFLTELRKSLLDLDADRASSARFDPAFGLLQERCNNLMLTIAALEDRLSAMQGLLDLGRPHVVHRVH